MNQPNKTSIFLPALVFCLLLLCCPASMLGDVLYTQTNSASGNAIVAFEQNSLTGELILKNVYPTSGAGNAAFVGFSQDSIVTDGRFLFAVNSGSNTISAFKIENNGALRLIGAPVSSGGLAPISLALFQGTLYVANQGDGASVPANYTGFKVHEDGSLMPIPQSTSTLFVGALPTDIRFSPDGSLLVASRRGDNTIETFRVTEDGRLVSAAALTGQSGAFGMEFNPAAGNNLIAGLIGVPGLTSYRIGKDGSIAVLGATVDTAAVDSCWAALLNNGQFAFFSGLFGQSVALTRVNPDGTLQSLSLHDTSAFGQFASDITLDTAQHFLYEVLPGSARIHVMRVAIGDGSNGGLTDVQTIPLPPQSSPIGLVAVRTEE